jgi:D-glycero-D-manno-heptose 1,7-bisphosphate phosphatase
VVNALTATATGGGRPAVFLDRDGVINRAVVRDGRPYPPDDLASFEFLPGVVEAVAALRAAGFVVVAATNQPDIATGKQSAAVVEAMHELTRRTLGLDDIRMCVHTDADGCACRKPKAGMLSDAAADLGLDLSRSYMVGDRWRDIDAGRAAGCVTFFIDYGYREKGPSAPPDHVVRDLAEAAQIILGQPAAGKTRPHEGNN